MASHDLTLKNYQKQLKDNIKSIHDNYIDILRTQSEHINLEVQVKSAEIVRSYQTLMYLVSEIRTFLIINELVGTNQPAATANNDAVNGGSGESVDTDEKLVKLRDEMSMFLYELEIPLP